MFPFGLLQAIASRVIIGIVALFTIFGFGFVSDTQEEYYKKDASLQQGGSAAVTELQTPRETEFAPTETQGIPAQPEESSEVSPQVPVQKTEVPKTTVEPSETSAVVATTTSSESPLSFSQINEETAKTLVNILCTQRVAGAVTPITGSGVFIDSKGVVITNAHVAQFFLLKDYPTKNSLECIIRTGSPARATYTAEVLFIPPAWVNLHAKDIRNAEPKGTGEYDFAFLRITGRTSPEKMLPSTFPLVEIDTDDTKIKTNDQVLAAAYPAGFLSGSSIQKDLFSVSSIATIGKRFTFRENTIDLFSIGGTVVSQGGSSGGAVVSRENKLIGIIVTSTRADTTAERDLRAITLAHVERALLEQEGLTLENLLAGDVAAKARAFNSNVFPTLTALYTPFLVQ